MLDESLIMRCTHVDDNADDPPLDDCLADAKTIGREKE